MTKIVWTETSPSKSPDGYCFGYLEAFDTLYLGLTHHAAIIAQLINEGVTWEQLMASRQLWGWLYDYGEPIDVSFATDEARQDTGIFKKTMAALKEAFPGHTFAANAKDTYQSNDEYGEAAKKQYLNKTAGSYDTPTEILPNGVQVFDVENVRTVSIKDDPSKFYACCFGYVNGKLYLGNTHHAKIIYNLVESGQHDYESLMSAEQKWGWATNERHTGIIDVRYTTDEAAQSHGKDLSTKVADSIGQYIGLPAQINEYVGEGYSNADTYGERSKEQYFGEGEEEPEQAYCEECDTYYDPEWESHDHNMQYCETCGDYFDQNEYGEHHTHEWLAPNLQNPQTQSYFKWGWDYLVKEYEDDLRAKIMDAYEREYLEEELRDWYTSSEDLTIESAGWLARRVIEAMRTNFIKHPPTPAWMPQGLYSIPTKLINPIGPPAPKITTRIARVTDLRDAEVFAKLAMDYINSDQGGTINNGIEIGSQWVDDRNLIHTVMSIKDGRINYSLPSGHGSMSVEAWPYYMKPLAEMVGGQTQQSTQTQTQDVITDPQAEGALKDDPALLAIERNPESAEWRWSLDDDNLHIWRVLNRWQYGPSHYDMFGRTGYEDHSQGRVYVSPDGRVGVLYWQISHPNAEQTLNDWVQKQFGKQPDMVYRAYGPYKGYKTPRWYFPIVEVSGLPIGNYSRWWERGEKPNQYYWDRGLDLPAKSKGYPAPKQKSKSISEAPADVTNPAKARRKRKRQRNKQYRNRGRR